MRKPLLLVCLGLSACMPNTGPDKTLAGAALGAAWGAGAGAVVGNQIRSNAGPGAAVGAGFGAVSGAMAGYGMDAAEDRAAEVEDQLLGLQIREAANQQQISQLQDTLDRAAANPPVGTLYQVYFDADETGMKTGSVAALEGVADSLKSNPAALRITVAGHSDDSGTPEYNERLAEARARNVAAYLAGRGISMDQIEIKSFGSTRPIASNDNPHGRQLNRRVEISLKNS